MNDTVSFQPGSFDVRWENTNDKNEKAFWTRASNHDQSLYKREMIIKIAESEFNEYLKKYIYLLIDNTSKDNASLDIIYNSMLLHRKVIEEKLNDIKSDLYNGIVEKLVSEVEKKVIEHDKGPVKPINPNGEQIVETIKVHVKNVIKNQLAEAQRNELPFIENDTIMEWAKEYRKIIVRDDTMRNEKER